MQGNLHRCVKDHSEAGVAWTGSLNESKREKKKKKKKEKKKHPPNFERFASFCLMVFSVKYHLLRTIGWKYTPALFRTITWSQTIGAQIWIFISLGCCGIPWHNTNENIVQTLESLFTFVYHLETEMAITIFRTIYVISGSKPAWLPHSVLSSVAYAVKCPFEVGKNCSCLYWVLVFYLGGKSTEAEPCRIGNTSHRNSEMNMDWFAWERFHEEAAAESHWGIKVAQWANRREKRP